MFDDANLRHIEAVCRFTYPPTFWQRRSEFCSLVKTAAFRSAYPNAHLIGTHDDIWDARQADPNLPNDFIPFLVVGEQHSQDYYGFPCLQKGGMLGTSLDELPVLVWAIHAYVHSWDAGFGSFLEWVSMFIASNHDG